MELLAISYVSKRFNVSTRTLRYYEQIGLIESAKKDGYAYRVYEEATAKKIKQIIILRKLSISLKNITRFMDNKNASEAIAVFQERLNEIEDEEESLSTLKSIIVMLRDTLKRDISINISKKMFNDEHLIELLDSIAPLKNAIKEKRNMEDLNKASEKLNEIKNVRIIYPPPATVASAHHVGAEPKMWPTVCSNNLSSKADCAKSSLI